SVTLERVSENLYRTKEDESFLPVGGLLPQGTDPAFREIFVDAAGYLALEAGGNEHRLPLAGPAVR
ncbi:MAG: hypothetical protein GWN73_01395, partial [Actinobacteria bacterium]|nr:hypothetical protein [Actinomycetota bacterium]NIS35429.1 hypothetical protein [Actinomycetota bacterium]NIU64157.1 hypothetical protein [Actinomycetota bacterium]NIW25955.1 hypothetical protein [Actinomycetota bacterium]